MLSQRFPKGTLNSFSKKYRYKYFYICIYRNTDTEILLYIRKKEAGSAQTILAT